VVPSPIGEESSASAPEPCSPAWCESLDPTAAIRFRFVPPLSIAVSQNATASGVNGFGPGRGGSSTPGGPVWTSIASTFA
jgi:hypothetical protein